MSYLKLLISIFCLQFFSGCASITGTTQQSVSVQTFEKNGKEISGAQCDLSNGKGKWFVNTPGSTGITRSNDDLMVVCKKDQYEPGSTKLASEVKGAMFGNILFGGGIGAIIDHTSGAAYEYPSLFKVIMGPSTNFPDFKAEPKDPLSSNMVVSQSKVSLNDAEESFKKLEQLKSLKDRSIITQEEFDKKKKEILSGI